MLDAFVALKVDVDVARRVVPFMEVLDDIVDAFPVVETAEVDGIVMGVGMVLNGVGESADVLVIVALNSVVEP